MSKVSSGFQAVIVSGIARLGRRSPLTAGRTIPLPLDMDGSGLSPFRSPAGIFLDGSDHRSRLRYASISTSEP